MYRFLALLGSFCCWAAVGGFACIILSIIIPQIIFLAACVMPSFGIIGAAITNKVL